MTDLSKQLGKIKRQHERDVFRSPCPEKAHNDRAALLHIIEVQIPGMLRERVEELDKERRTAEFYTAKFGLAAGAQELSDMADAIESLTKDNANEKENG